MKILMIISLLFLVSCSPLDLLGGTNVAANTQAGQTNNQTIGATINNTPSVTVRPKARVETIDQSTATTNNYDLPIWVYVVFILLFILGWVTDTPKTYWKRITKGKKYYEAQ